jgi:hypothetical protein
VPASKRAKGVTGNGRSAGRSTSKKWVSTCLRVVPCMRTWATNAPEFVPLLRDRGWPVEPFQHWLADTWQRVLRAEYVPYHYVDVDAAAV